MKMIKSKKILLAYLLILLLFGTSQLLAQDIQISMNYAQGIKHNEWSAFKGGFELSADYRYSINDVRISSGIDFRTIQWGNQVTVSLGLSKVISSQIELGIQMQHGLALFHPQSLYVFSAGTNCDFTLVNNDNFQMGLSLEARYSMCPAYKNYGQLYHVTEIPLGLFIRF